MYLQACGFRYHVSGGVGSVQVMLRENAGVGGTELYHQVLPVVMRHNSNIHLSISFLGFLSDPQQRRFTALQSNCDISVCAGRSIVRAQQKGSSLI